MKAEDIRRHSELTFEVMKTGLAKDNNIQSAAFSAQAHLMQAVWEIAAQLADLNEHFRMVDAAVFGAKK